MRAALERIASASRPECEWAKRALAEVDALPENDTEELRKAYMAVDQAAAEMRAEAAEARLARVDEVLSLALRESTPSDDGWCEVYRARDIARSVEPS